MSSSNNTNAGSVNGAATGRNVSSSSRQVTPGTTPAASGSGGGGGGSSITSSNTSTALLNTNMERIAFSVIDRALGFTIGGTPAYIDDNTSSSGINNGPTAASNGTNLTTAVGSIVGATTTNGATVAAATAASGNGTGVNTVVGTPVSTPGPTTTNKPNPRRRKKLHG